MRRLGTTASLLVTLAAIAVGSSAAFGGLSGKPIEDYRYDPATHCTKKVPSGMKELEDWLQRNTSGETWGITRCEKLSEDSYSLHSEGRAIDWHMDSRIGRKKHEAMHLIRKVLLGTDRQGNDNALARRMGVQGIIYDCKAWWSSPGGLGKYSYCYKENGKRKKHLDPTAAHMDHIHVELNWPGARERTSFWRK